MSRPASFCRAHRRGGPGGRLRGGAGGRDRGDVAIEAAVVAPVLFFLMFAGITVAGRSMQAKNQAEAAAQEAARAASMEQTPAAAVLAGQAALDANAAEHAETMVCSAAFDAGDLRPGSVVSVEVSCDAELVAGQSWVFMARAVEVVDRYRQGDTG